ncbi:PREDICTED: cholecystokinin receptor-like [Priapulus caudatus]|uniref:Cholecystokinin receptor-like n=1 Tax=Priapulus caudatus TaxID=37621 RepID=A0ABM1ELH1_PRICU|nr:PREDICTED: cholecystokinin receptor-like [Priapulus caudatus]
MVPFLENTVAAGSVLTILAISFERYYAICRPLQAQYTCTKMRTLKIILVQWLLAAVACLPYVAMTDYGDAPYVDGSTVKTCGTNIDESWEKGYFIWLWFLFFALPLIVLLALYTLISRTLMCDDVIICNKNDPKYGDNQRARKQVVMMLFAVVVLFFVCLLPFRVFSLWTVFSDTQQVYALGLETFMNIIYFVRVMFYLNSAVNPIIYNVMSTKFRKAFLRALGCRRVDMQRSYTNHTSMSHYSQATSHYASGRTSCAYTHYNYHRGNNETSVF